MPETSPTKITLSRAETEMVWSLATALVDPISQTLHQPPSGHVIEAAIDQALQTFLEVRGSLLSTGRIVHLNNETPVQVFFSFESQK